MSCKVMYTGAIGWLVRCRGVDRWSCLATGSQDKWQTPVRVQNPAYRPAVFSTYPKAASPLRLSRSHDPKK